MNSRVYQKLIMFINPLVNISTDSYQRDILCGIFTTYDNNIKTSISSSIFLQSNFLSQINYKHRQRGICSKTTKPVITMFLLRSRLLLNHTQKQ